MWATRQSQQVQQVLQVKADMGVMASHSQTLEERPRVELRRTLASKEGWRAGLLGVATIGSSFGNMRRETRVCFRSTIKSYLSRCSSDHQDELDRSFTGGVRFVIANVRRDCAAA